MAASNTVMDLATLPKIELHLHLDCSLSYEAAVSLRPGLTLETYGRQFMAPAKCVDLAEALSAVANAVALLQTEQGLRVATQDLFQQLHRDHVIYAEIRFAPLLHTEQGLRPEEVVEIVIDSVASASATTGVESRLILCTLRHFSQAQSLQTVRLVERFQGTHVAAFDIAADEAGFPIDAHIAAFHYAIARDIPRTAHAGEARGPESVWETLEVFKPSRLGHGVRSIEDPELIGYLGDQDIHLEICPTSNVITDIYESYADHDIDRFCQAGVSVGINTDGRTLGNVTLTQEYEQLQRCFQWGTDQLLKCNLNALRASFAPDQLKRRLEGQLMASTQGSECDSMRRE